MSLSTLRGISLVLVLGCCLSATLAQDDDSIYSFGGDAAFVSKYIWRGQRLTNDWSMQPSMTFGASGFSFNVWGNMDMTAVNEGDSLFLQENPLAPLGDHSGLKGKFSEVDYTFSFAHSFDQVSIDTGTIFYTFPERSASLPATTEIYFGVTADNVALAPSATIYIDVDETSADSGDTGVYILLSAGHSFALAHNTFSALDVSTSLSFVNGGFGSFYYGDSQAGAHDFNFTASLPITITDEVSASAFLSYSTLIGNFQDFQFLDPRDVFLGTSGTPSSLADTVWGGFTLSVGF